MASARSIVFVCVANSLRSQMAEAIAKSLGGNWEVWSAGSNPAIAPRPSAVGGTVEQRRLGGRDFAPLGMGVQRRWAGPVGLNPGGAIHPLAVTLMREQGLELSGHHSKGVDALPDRRWDYVVTMGCGDRCPTLRAAHHLDWDIPDPAGRPLQDARRIRDDLAARVRVLLAQAA